MAIETRSQGHLFRSRLEARWAELFTFMGWAWEYEPFDANGYIPDFVLTGECPVLVEVKPVATHDEYWGHTAKLEQALEGVWAHDILIVGISPAPAITTIDPWPQFPTIGLLGERFDDEGCWSWATGRWSTCTACTANAFIHEYQSYRSRPCGHYDGDHYMGIPEHTPDALAHVWGYCHERTRWKP